MWRQHSAFSTSGIFFAEKFGVCLYPPFFASWLFGDAFARAFLGGFIYENYGWRFLFQLSAYIGLAYLAVLFLFSSNSPTDFRWSIKWKFLRKIAEKHSQEVEEKVAIVPSTQNDEPEETVQKEKPKRTLKEILRTQYLPLFKSPAFWIMTFTYSSLPKKNINFHSKFHADKFGGKNLAIALLRYTLFFWSPTYLSQIGASDGEAAVGSLLFPLGGGFGAVLIGVLNDRCKKNVHKNLLMFFFFLVCSASFFVLWFLVDRAIVSVWSTLLLYGVIGFSLLSVYSLPSGVVSIRFGKDTCATCSGLMDLASSIAMAFSGLMSQIAGEENRWDRVWFVCSLLSIISCVLLFIFVLVDKKEDQDEFVKN